MSICGCNSHKSNGADHFSDLAKAGAAAGNRLELAESELAKVLSDPEAKYEDITAAQQKYNKVQQLFTQLQKLLESAHQTMMQVIRSMRAQ